MTPDPAVRRSPPQTRKSLLMRLRNWQDQESWQEFHRTYQRLVLDSALRAGLNQAEAQEVLQETLLAVAKKIAGFNYDPDVGSFRGWLLKITRRRIVDQFRKRRPTIDPEKERNGHPLTELPDGTESRLEALWKEEWHQVLLEMARTMVKRKVTPRQYRMFELYAVQQMPLKEVARTVGVSAAQVYMAKYRVAQMLRKEIKRLEKEEL